MVNWGFFPSGGMATCAAVKHFLETREALVADALMADVTLAGGALRLLEGFPAIKVILRAEIDRTNVAVVSGGGSGHEPAHAGFVGDGMLTAAVCGEVFASPSVDAVLAAIEAVTGPAGCLLVVKNYTGDRLNFGLAAEKARARGIAVETVLVADDVALPDATRPRGIAGTLFVHKVAGHYARAGRSLAEVKGIAERVARGSVSIGASLSSVNIPGQVSENRIGENQIELGLGIHGEPGASVIELPAISRLATIMVERLENRLGGDRRDIALLLNDLGGVPPIELSVIAGAVLRAVTAHDVRLVIGPERLMTSLDMRGFSISALGVDAEIEEGLRSEVGVRAWPGVRTPGKVDVRANANANANADANANANANADADADANANANADAGAWRDSLRRVCGALIAAEGELDGIDAKVGDGDTGSTLAGAARGLLADLDTIPASDSAAFLGGISDRLSHTMGGSSGVLLAILTAGAAARVNELGWLGAIDEGVKRMQEYGGAKLGDRTMLDALVPALAALADGDLAAASKAAADGAARTATMSKANAGRSSYVREDALLGIPDPGAVAVAKVFEALR